MDLGFITVGGITGAAIATMCTYISLFILMLFFSYKSTKIIPFSTNILKSLVSGIVAVSAVYIIARLLFVTFPIHVLIGLSFLFLTFYILSLLLLKGATEEDVELLKAVEKKGMLKLGFLRKILKRFI